MSPAQKIPTEISRTARVLAARRAAATEIGSPLVRDPYAQLFAEDELIELARASVHEAHYVVLRHRLLEDFVIAPPVPAQVVLLGAGLDTKYARFEALRAGAFLEVDTAEMLAHKAAILQANGLPVAPSVAAAITSVDDLAAILQRTDPALPTAFLAEGFFMYHHPEPVTFAMLDLIIEYYQHGLRLGFDLFAPELTQNPEFQALRVKIEAHGEVFGSFIPTERTSAFLAQRGIEHELWPAERLSEHFLGTTWTGMPGLYACCAQR